MEIVFSILLFLLVFTMIMTALNDGHPIKYSSVVAKNEGFFTFFSSWFYAIFVLDSKYVKVSLISVPVVYIDSKTYGIVEMACRKALNGDVKAVHAGDKTIKFSHRGSELILTFDSIYCTFDNERSVVIPPKLALLIEAAAKHNISKKVEKKNVFDIN